MDPMGNEINSHEFIVIVLLKNEQSRKRKVHENGLNILNKSARVPSFPVFMIYLTPARKLAGYPYLGRSHRLPHVCAIVRSLHVSSCRIFALAQM